MKKIHVIAFLSFITIGYMPSSAWAGPGVLTSPWMTPVTVVWRGPTIMEYIFPPETSDFKPYLENSRQAQNSPFRKDNWQPADWTAQRPQIIRDFYNAKIITDQDVDDDIPVLEVGQGFYMLGGEDKRRIVRYMDAAYNITSTRSDGIIILRDSKTGDDIGVYTSAGLQLQ